MQEWKLLQRKLNKVFAGANVVSRLDTTKTITGFFLDDDNAQLACFGCLAAG